MASQRHVWPVARSRRVRSDALQPVVARTHAAERRGARYAPAQGRAQRGRSHAHERIRSATESCHVGEPERLGGRSDSRPAGARGRLLRRMQAALGVLSRRLQAWRDPVRRMRPQVSRLRFVVHARGTGGASSPPGLVDPTTVRGSRSLARRIVGLVVAGLGREGGRAQARCHDAKAVLRARRVEDCDALAGGRRKLREISWADDEVALCVA